MYMENMRAGFQGQIDALKAEMEKGKNREPQPPIQIGAPLPNQQTHPLQQQQQYPVVRAYPGAVHQNMQMMMANQNLSAHHPWINQNPPYPTLSS